MDYEKLNALAQSEITKESGITRGIRDYIFWVRNKLWLVVLITIVGIVFGIYVTTMSPKIYESTASIEIERVERGDSLEDSQANYREEAFLGGDAIINTVTQKLLVPEILESVVVSNRLHERDDIIKMSFLKNLSKSEETLKLEPKQVVGMMLAENWVKIVPRRRSYIADITVSHTNPEVAYLIANGILEASKKSVEEKINQDTDMNVRMADQMVAGAEKEILELNKCLK